MKNIRVSCVLNNHTRERIKKEGLKTPKKTSFLVKKEDFNSSMEAFIGFDKKKNKIFKTLIAKGQGGHTLFIKSVNL